MRTLFLLGLFFIYETSKNVQQDVQISVLGIQMVLCGPYVHLYSWRIDYVDRLYY